MADVGFKTHLPASSQHNNNGLLLARRLQSVAWFVFPPVLRPSAAEPAATLWRYFFNELQHIFRFFAVIDTASIRGIESFFAYARVYKTGLRTTQLEYNIIIGKSKKNRVKYKLRKLSFKFNINSLSKRISPPAPSAYEYMTPHYHSHFFKFTYVLL